MAEVVESQVAELSGGELQRVLSRVFSVLRRSDTHRTDAGGDLTLAQLSILLTLLEQGPMRMTDLAAHERVRTRRRRWRSADWRSSAW